MQPETQGQVLSCCTVHASSIMGTKQRPFGYVLMHSYFANPCLGAHGSARALFTEQAGQTKLPYAGSIEGIAG